MTRQSESGCNVFHTRMETRRVSEDQLGIRVLALRGLPCQALVRLNERYRR